MEKAMSSMYMVGAMKQQQQVPAMMHFDPGIWGEMMQINSSRIDYMKNSWFCSLFCQFAKKSKSKLPYIDLKNKTLW
jgi:hypothetical protein